MAEQFHHERLYRGESEMQKLAGLRLTLCGAGAVGSHLADNLVRQGAKLLRVIDHDRVDEHNVSTQLYGQSEVGAWKAEALRNRLFRATGIEIDAIRKQLTDASARQLLDKSDLVIDAFDNSAARRLVQETCRAQSLACMHIGLYEDYCEVIWDEAYRIPQDVAGDVCDYPLARNLVLLAVVIATESVREFMQGAKISRSATLKDFAVKVQEV